jgi:hypothetical protein
MPTMTKTEDKKPNTEIPEQWVSAARDNLSRLQATMNAYWDELATFENAAYERARSAAADVAALASESISYVAALTNEWRRISIETTKRFADSFKA